LYFSNGEQNLLYFALLNPRVSFIQHFLGLCPQDFLLATDFKKRTLLMHFVRKLSPGDIYQRDDANELAEETLIFLLLLLRETVDFEDVYGDTALSIAVRLKKYEFALILAKEGRANINVCNRNKEVPLITLVL